MKALLRTLFFAAIIGGIILFVASRFMGQGVGDAPQADVDAAIIDQMTVERGNLSVSVSGTGTLLPARQAPLVFAASAPVVEILKREGEAVSEGEVIASLDTADFSAVIQDAELAVEAQRLAFNALTAAPREVDIAVAEAALTAAQAGFNAALQTGPNANQEEIARLQVELARNQLWQTQLQSERPGFDFGSIPGFDQIPEDIQSLITSQLGALTGGGVSQTQADISLNQLEFQIQIADANRQSVQAQGPDLGALNSANAGRRFNWRKPNWRSSRRAPPCATSS
jgi:multidrug efflux pump subunit AcrA (membrane-fusion protein)